MGQELAHTRFRRGVQCCNIFFKPQRLHDLQEDESYPSEKVSLALHDLQSVSVPFSILEPHCTGRPCPGGHFRHFSHLRCPFASTIVNSEDGEQRHSTASNTMLMVRKTCKALI